MAWARRSRFYGNLPAFWKPKTTNTLDTTLTIPSAGGSGCIYRTPRHESSIEFTPSASPIEKNMRASQRTFRNFFFETLEGSQHKGWGFSFQFKHNPVLIMRRRSLRRGAALAPLTRAPIAKKCPLAPEGQRCRQLHATRGVTIAANRIGFQERSKRSLTPQPLQVYLYALQHISCITPREPRTDSVLTSAAAPCRLAIDPVGSLRAHGIFMSAAQLS
jgi:hypothetical protein